MPSCFALSKSGRNFSATCALVAAILWALPATRAADDALRLVAELGGERFHDFKVGQQKIFGVNTTGEIDLSRGVKWKIEGDLRAASDRIEFSPNYGIYRGVAGATLDSLRDGYVAVVHLRFAKDVWEKQIGDAVAVVLWMVDGQAVKTIVAPTASGPLLHSNHAALVPIELTTEESRGAPLVLVWNAGAFVAPRPRFSDPTLNVALSEMYLGALTDFERAVAAVDSINQRTHSGVTLFQYAAEGGFVAAMQALRSRKASFASGDREWGTPLHAAAINGRLDAVEWLMAENPHRQRRGDNRTPFDLALGDLRLDVAVRLIGPKWSDDSQRLLVAAIRYGDVAIAQSVVNLPGAKLNRKTAIELLAACARRGDVELVNVLLLQLGAPADADYEGWPLLLLAARSGDVRCVEALLRAGAKIDRAAKNGETALRVARAAGADGVVNLLMGQGGPAAVALATSGDSMDGRKERASAIAAQADEVVHASSAVDVLPTVTFAQSIEPEMGVTELKQGLVQSVEPVASWGRTGGLELQNRTFTRTEIIGAEQTIIRSWAVVKFIVERDGRVTEPAVVRASSKTFSKRAVEAVRQFRFSPGEKDGASVRTRMVLAVMPKE